MNLCTAKEILKKAGGTENHGETRSKDEWDDGKKETGEAR